MRTLGGVGLWSTDAGEARAGRHRCKSLAGVVATRSEEKNAKRQGLDTEPAGKDDTCAKVPQASCRFQFGQAGQSGARAMRQRGADDRSP